MMGGNAWVGTEKGWVALLCLVQFFHWFKPSEPELYGILSDVLHLNRHQILDDVFAWSVYWEPLSYLGCLLVYLVAGYRHALVLVTVLNLVTVALVLTQVELMINKGHWYVLASFYELTWTGGFTMLFVVSASTYDVLPTSFYQVATSCTRCAALVSTVTSSLLGTAMSVGWGKTSTLYVSVASSFMSLAVLAFALCAGYMPAKLLAQGESPASRAMPASGKLSLRELMPVLLSMQWLTPLCVFWVLVVSVTLATHIVVMTQIQGLMHEHFERIGKSDTSNIYGVIQAVAYLVAVVATLSPVYFHAEVCRVARVLALGALSLSSMLLLWINHCYRSLWPMALAFVLYHSAAEFVLVLGKTELAKELDQFACEQSMCTADGGDECSQTHMLCSKHRRRRALLRKLMIGSIFCAVFVASWAAQFALTIMLPSSKFETHEKFQYYAFVLVALVLVACAVLGLGRSTRAHLPSANASPQIGMPTPGADSSDPLLGLENAVMVGGAVDDLSASANGSAGSRSRDDLLMGSSSSSSSSKPDKDVYATPR